MSPATSIDRISGDGLAEMFQMDSDLVGASCARTAFDKGLAFFRGEDAVVCERIATTFIDGHFLAVSLVSSDGGIDLAVWHSRCPIYKCKIGFLDSPRGELGSDESVGLFGLGHNETTRCFLIESVNDPRALDPANHSDAFTMV